MLVDLQDEQRRKDRQGRGESAMRSHLRHEATAKAKKAQDAEYRRLAKRREAQQKRAQEDEQRRRDKQRRDDSAIKKKKVPRYY